jgi:hypothetical protein
LLITVEVFGPPCRMPMNMVVRMKSTKEVTVSLWSRVVALRAPKAVCVLPPPNTERSAPLPCWRSTTRMRKTQTMTWMTYSR